MEEVRPFVQDQDERNRLWDLIGVPWTDPNEWIAARGDESP